MRSRRMCVRQMKRSASVRHRSHSPISILSEYWPQRGETDAGAIHPGYGFLSENAEFAAACESAGIVYIGPSAAAVELMGNKALAKAHMISNGVACVPGYAGEDPSDDAFIEAAGRIGYPVMIKAAAGGGGRGMRQVNDPKDLKKALARARSGGPARIWFGRNYPGKSLARAAPR